jgi:hypothetical protein
MSKPINSRGLYILSLFFLGVSVISCTPSTQNAAATQPSTSETATLESTSFATSYLTLTPSVTEPASSADLTQLANDGYLFPSDIEDPMIAEVIHLALTDRIGIASFGGEPFCSYELLMPLHTDVNGTIKVYLQVLCQEYYENNGDLQSGTGISIPVALTLEEREEGWSVEHQTPEAGNWGPSLREIFPSQSWPRISDPTGRTADGKTLTQNNIQQAEEYFGLLVDPTPRWLLPATPTKTPRPTSSVLIITSTPTPTLPALSTLTLEVSRVSVSQQSSVSGPFWISVRLESVPRLSTGPLNNRLTPFQKGLLSSGWRVYVYQRRADNEYSNQAALVLDDVKDPHAWEHTFEVEFTQEEVLDQLGDHRDLVYQIVDRAGNVSWQGEFYDSTGLSQFPAEYGAETAEGVVVGYPKLVSENAVLFAHQGTFIPIEQLRGGFDHLHYEFDFLKESGTTMTAFELDALIKESEIRVFPYREDGDYAIESSFTLSGRTLGGGGPFFRVHFPYDWLSETSKSDQKYYLRIVDGEGNIYIEEYFHFIPTAP